MRQVASGFLLILATIALGQQPESKPAHRADIMLAAVARDQSLLTGGIGPSNRLKQGKVAVEPMVRLTSFSEWKNVPCAPGGKGCRKFEREYLSKPHSYTIISAEGKGTTIQAAPATLNECYGFLGKGTYSGAAFSNSAIAASSLELFDDSEPLRNLEQHEIAVIRQSIARFVPEKLDSTRNLRFIATRLEGHEIVVVQRAYSDFADPNARAQFVFVIGMIEQSQFHPLHWKKHTAAEDEEETLIGTIRLKSGHDFLITTVSDPESHFYRIYGFKEGKLVMVYSGGGSSC